MHGVYSYWCIPVVLAIMIRALVLWHLIQSVVLISVTIVIPSGGWWVCLGILHPVSSFVVLLILLTFSHGDKQFHDTHTGVVPLMHYH